MSYHRHVERMSFAFNSDARPATVRLALFTICHYADEDGIYRQGPERIAPLVARRGTLDQIGVARRAILKLIEGGYIEPVVHPGRPYYRIRFEKGEDHGLVQG